MTKYLCRKKSAYVLAGIVQPLAATLEVEVETVFHCPTFKIRDDLGLNGSPCALYYCFGNGGGYGHRERALVVLHADVGKSDVECGGHGGSKAYREAERL